MANSHCLLWELLSYKNLEIMNSGHSKNLHTNKYQNIPCMFSKNSLSLRLHSLSWFKVGFKTENQTHIELVILDPCNILSLNFYLWIIKFYLLFLFICMFLTCLKRITFWFFTERMQKMAKLFSWQLFFSFLFGLQIIFVLINFGLKVWKINKMRKLFKKKYSFKMSWLFF